MESIEVKRPASEELLLELPLSKNAPFLETESAERARSEVLWRSCCAEMDSRALLFFSQQVIAVGSPILCGANSMTRSGRK